MKKVFITAIAEQSGRFDNPIYAASQENLRNEQREHYPVFCVMENAVKDADDMEIIAIRFPGDALERNYDLLCERAKLFERQHGIPVKITDINHETGESAEAHTALFGELTRKIPDCCELYADITYGTKPTPMLLFAVLCFINTVRINTDVKQITYGKINWKRVPNAPSEIESAHIYDVTRLLKIISITERLAALGEDDVESSVRILLGLEGGE